MSISGVPQWCFITATAAHSHLSFEELRIRQLEAAPHLAAPPFRPVHRARRAPKVPSRLAYLVDEAQARRERARAALQAEVAEVLDALVLGAASEAAAWLELEAAREDAEATEARARAERAAAEELERVAREADEARWSPRYFFERHCKQGATAGMDVVRERQRAEQQKLEAQFGKGVDVKTFKRMLTQTQ